ncbi:TM0106 family RecB-like putative nuclease [Allomesorhizobium camelthorni]|uniref:TM0106 family RecB-like putative nuclease n=1 Tax=Allomesorhizobium camelthorni TaxID=475069 RepID=A0A6G4WMA8_9HYPH|nr:TM0106 family RecB-like putative nuclease [Mesorhizobium camelthorni]NGO55901.1 TM0106 family RecB-like putative nuclease [Mesorhizobium camelthorni]
MDASANISAAVFAAYLKCSTKAYLTAHGEKSPDSFFADTLGRTSAAYKARVSQGPRMGSTNAVSFDYLRQTGVPAEYTPTLLVDCETAACARDLAVAVRVGNQTERADPGHDYVPIVFSAWNKRDRSDDLLVCFGAMAIQQATGEEIPSYGRVIYGEGERDRTVRIDNHLPKARQIVEAIASASLAGDPPPLILNNHCAMCDFQARCRALAIEREDLSLLGAMTAKERSRNSEKGISTITQLSYGYRPRRRRRIKSTAPRASPPVKHDHKLKALAIKKAQTHVVGSPTLSIQGTPVFMDVEGVPDRDYYYLIGLRYEAEGIPVEKSFWADGPEGEREIWRQCLCALKLVEKPQIVHHGAYESRFLKAMRERWPASFEDAEFLDRLIDGSVNLLGCIYGRIYFPTYSNGLKDIARWLGFEWTWPQASGSAAMLVRRCWELTSDERLRRELIAYNIEDCRAAELVAEALARICGTGESGGKTKLETVNVESLEVGFQRTFGKFPSALPEFEKINAAAYWDYQRSKVYVRTNKAIRRTIEKSVKPVKKVAVEKEATIDDRPACCPRCGASKVWVAKRLSQTVFDLKFTRRGIKRWVVRYRYNSYRCGACKAEMTIYQRRSKFGQNLCAYIIYLLIEMRLSRQNIAEHVATLFNVSITASAVHNVKSAMARYYEPTYRWILEQIRSGPLVNADETKGVVYGGGHYVWTFANLTAIAYVYSSSREASILDETLADFKGVLVSDFYGAYDAVPCQQQKCLIHLMRDINEDMLKHPFNEELTFIATRFGSLLREIVETIDRYGLKKRNLGKHKRSAERFLNDVAELRCATEVGIAMRKRIEKNKEKLFAFLDYDDVPWNNNNAEHAVRAYTRIRNVMASSTPKGTNEYCILLSLQQTLRCRGIPFLDFLQSRRSEID